MPQSPLLKVHCTLYNVQYSCGVNINFCEKENRIMMNAFSQYYSYSTHKVRTLACLVQKSGSIIYSVSSIEVRFSSLSGTEVWF